MTFHVSKEWIMAKADEEDGFDVTAGRPATKRAVSCPALTQDVIVAEKRQKILADARQLFNMSPDWVTLFLEVLGVQGIARTMFPSTEELVAFEQSTEFREIQQLIARRREECEQGQPLPSLPISG